MLGALCAYEVLGEVRYSASNGASPWGGLPRGLWESVGHADRARVHIQDAVDSIASGSVHFGICSPKDIMDINRQGQKVEVRGQAIGSALRQ